MLLYLHRQDETDITLKKKLMSVFVGGISTILYDNMS